MNSVVLVMLLAAEPSGFSYEGAGTAFIRPASTADGSAGLGAGAHLGLGLGYEAESVFVEGRGSFLLSYNGAALSFQDLGSHLAVGYRPHGFVEELRLTVWPFNSVTALPVFDWANRMGLRPLEFNPAMSLQATTPIGSAWATARFRSVTNVRTNVYEVRPDLFFGVNTVLPRGFAFDVRAAWFQYGQVPSLGMSGVEAYSDGFMVSGRLSWRLNESVGPAMDFDLYGTDPWRFERFFVEEPRITRAAVYLALEGGGGAQKLVDPDTYSSLKSQPLGWGDFQLRVRVQETRLFLTGRVHTTSLETADWGPGLPPFVAWVRGSMIEPRLEMLAGFDTTWRAARLTPGILVRLTRSAWVQAPSFDFGGANPIPGLSGPRKVTVADGYLIGILPHDSEVQPKLGVKFSLKWEPVSFLMVAGELNLEKDWNDIYFDPSALNQGTPTKLAVRGQVLLQARF